MSEIRTDSKPQTELVILAWVATVLTLGYMLPWAVAASRGKSNQGAIALVNLLAGWTVIGWIVALVMACGPHQVVHQVIAVPAVPAAPVASTWIDPETGGTVALNPATGEPMWVDPVTGLPVPDPVVATPEV